jgi:hypothetical protein
MEIFFLKFKNFFFLNIYDKISNFKFLEKIDIIGLLNIFVKKIIFFEKGFWIFI